MLALLGPLLWDRSKSLGRNLGALAALGAGLLALGVVGVDAAIALFSWGVSWIWAHDVLLGVCYFALIASTLRRGAWLREPGRSVWPKQLG